MNKVHTHIGRGKLAIFAVVAFLGLVTYLLITMSTQLAEMPVTSGSQARVTLIGPTVTPVPIALGIACGKECGVRGAGSDWEKACESGSTCKYDIIAFGIQVGVCRPVSGGSCPKVIPPMPVTTCGRVCSDEAGTETHICPVNTTCTSVGFLGYKTCRPTNGGSCPNTTIQIGRGGDLQPAPTLPIADCGGVCISRQSGSPKTIAQCVTGTTCQSNPTAGGYGDDSRCYPAGSYGQCAGYVQPGLNGGGRPQ